MSNCVINTPEFTNLEKTINYKVAYRESARSSLLGVPMRSTYDVLSDYWAKGEYLHLAPYPVKTYSIYNYNMYGSEYASLNSDYNSSFNSNGYEIKVLNTIASKLSDKLNVNYTFISALEAIRLTESLPENRRYKYGTTGFYFNNQVYFVNEFVNERTVFHEFSHPLVRSIRLSNRTLFDNLYESLEASNPALVANIKAGYSEMELEMDSIKEEIIVTALEDYAINYTDSNNKPFSTWINELLYQIKRIFRKFIGKDVKIERLKATTTLSELANLLNNDATISITKDYNTESDVIAYKKAIDVQMNTLLNIKDEKALLKTINQTYTDMSRVITNMKRNQNYDQIKELVKDVYDKSELDLIRQGLSEFRELPFEKDLAFENQRAQAFINSLYRMQNVVNKINGQISELSKNVNDKNDLQQAYYLANILKNLNNTIDSYIALLTSEYVPLNNPLFEIVTNIKATINNSMTYVKEIYAEGGVDAAYEILAPYGETIDLKFQGILEHLNKINAPDWMIAAKTAEYESLKITRDKVRRLMIGELGDAHVLNSLLEGYMNNQDPIVFGLALYVKNAYTDMFNRSYAKVNDFILRVEALAKEAGYNPNDVAALTKQLVFLDEVGESVQEGSEFISKTVYTFLNPWKNYKRTLSEMSFNIKKAINEGDANKAQILKEEKREFMKKWFHSEMNSEYYRIKDLLGVDDIGKKAKEQLDIIDNEIISIQDGSINNFLDLEDIEAIKMLKERRKKLFSLYDEYGKLKQGDNLLIAERLMEYMEKSRSMYISRLNQSLFQNAFDNFVSGLKAKDILENTAEYRDEIERWITLNTRYQVKQSFYQERSAIYEEIERLKLSYRKLVNLPTDQNIKISEYYDELNKLLYQHRNSDQQPEALKMSVQILRRIKNLHVLIEEELKNSLTDNGLTANENEFLRKYFIKKAAYSNLESDEKPTAAEDQMAKALLDKKISFNNKAYKGKSMAEVKVLKQAEAIKTQLINKYTELNELQSRVPTNDYMNIIQKHTSSFWFKFSLYDAQLSEEDSAMIENLVKELDTLGFLVIDENNIQDLLSNEFLVAKMLKASRLTDNEFRQWFNSNHYKIVRGENIEYRPTNAWTLIVPQDKDYLETSTLNMPDGSTRTIDRLPDSKFYSFQIDAEKFKTKKVTIKEALEQGDLSLANFDEMNETWLPKMLPDSPFRNSEYFNLKTSNPNMFKLLTEVLKYHVENQQNHSTKDTLGFEMPRYRASRYETLRYSGEDIDPETGEPIKRSRLYRFLRDVESYFKRKPDDLEKDYNPDESHYAIASELFDEYDDKIIVRGKYDIETSLVSMDVFSGLNKYMTSLERKKVLSELNPVARAIQSVVNDPDNKIKELKQTFVNGLVNKSIFRSKKDDGVRQNAVNNFIEREFESVNQKGIYKDNQVVQSIASGLQKISALNMFAFNIDSALKNFWSQRIQGAIESSAGTYYNPMDYHKGVWWGNKVMAEISFQIYNFQPKSLNIQIVDLFDIVTGRAEQKLGEQMSRSLLTDLVNSPAGMMTNFRKWSEQSSEIGVGAAILYNVTVEQTIDGVTNTIPYIEAWEQDPSGTIKLKEGIDKTYDIGGREFKKIKNKIAAVTNDVNGAFGSFDNAEAERYFAFRAWMFLRKWFVRMFINRFGARKVGLNPLNWQERYDVGKDDTTMGFYMQSIRATTILIKSGFSNLHLLSDRDKAAFMRVAVDFLFMIASTLFMSLILGFDKEDPDKYEKLRRKSGALPTPFTADTPYDFKLGGYLENHLLYVMLGTRQEQLQWIPLPGFGLDDYVQYLQLQPIALSNTINTLVKALGAVVNVGNEKGEYQRTVGPYEWQQQESKKFINYLLKTFGISGTQVDPVLAIRNFNAIQARKGS